MQFYEIATLSIQMGKVADVASGVERFVTEEGALGKLLGIWFTDIGDLNQVLVLRGFSTQSELLAERERTLTANDPFYAKEWLDKLSLDSYKPFPFTSPVQTGTFGNIYEIRTYGVKQGCLSKGFEVWEEAVPTREQYSKMTAALYSLDGNPRIVSIWPYDSVNERSQIRQDVVNAGIWPPKGGPACLTNDMVSLIGIPTGNSPLK